MRIIASLLIIILTLLSCQPETASENLMSTFEKMDVTPPIAEKKPKELTIHGDTRIDNYYWLNQREEPEVISYLTAENEYLDQVLAHTKDFQEKLFDEIVGRIKQDDQSVPFKDNGYYYITRYEEGKEYPIYSRKKETLEAVEEVMLNVNELAEPYEYYAVGGRDLSLNNRYLAYGEDTLSRRIYTLRVKDLETGEILEDKIPGTSGSVAWAADNQHFFYTLRDPETLRAYQVMRHKLGTATSEDVEVFTEEDETFSCYAYRTKSDKYIVIGSFQTLSSEFRILEAQNPLGEFRIFTPRERKLEHTIAHYNDKFYIRTNLNAKNFRLMETPENATSKDNWKEVIPHREDVLLEGMDIFRDYLVLSERKAGIIQLRVRPWEGEEHYIEFEDEAYLAYTSTNPQFDTDLLRIGYTSLTTPNTTYDYNMKTRAFTQLKQVEVMDPDFDPANYVSERIMATARDGAEVPISIVYRKGFKKDGQQPLLLYGYGSYGNSMDPYFSSVRLSLLDRGFAYAMAHIRGGEEMGRQWYEEGKLLNKKNTFTDFIDCAEHLIANNYTSPDHLYAMGGSAGGLLMGAIVNMRPDLWNGVVAAVPFVDVVTTMLDESIPLTTFEYDEWGNPNDPVYYEYIKSYSPYDNVEAKDYPSMLVTTGLHDSQVQYWEPAKWVAKLREMKTDNKPLLLHTNMDAGHGGTSGRFRRFRETAMEYAFMLDLEGKVELKN